MLSAQYIETGVNSDHPGVRTDMYVHLHKADIHEVFIEMVGWLCLLQ